MGKPEGYEADPMLFACPDGPFCQDAGCRDANREKFDLRLEALMGRDDRPDVANPKPLAPEERERAEAALERTIARARNGSLYDQTMFYIGLFEMRGVASLYGLSMDQLAGLLVEGVKAKIGSQVTKPRA